MADNSTLPTITGNEVFKNRDVGSVKWPELIAYFGDVGAGIPIKDAVGNRLPVLATQNGVWTVAISGTTTVSGAVTISGTVAVTQSGTWNVGLSAALPTGANVIGAVTQSGTWNITVSNTSIPVTQSGTWNIGSITTLPAITGTVTANQGGTWTVSINPAQLSPPGQTTSAASAGVVPANDYGFPFATDKMFAGTTSLTPKFAQIATSATNTTIIAAVTSKKLRVLAAKITANGVVNAKWQSTTATDKTGLSYFAAAGDGEVLPFNPVGWFETNSGELLNLNLSAAVAVGGHLTYIEV